MRLFFELARLAFQRQMTYRAATLAGLAVNLFFGFLRISVLLALYGAQPEVAGLDTQDAITYTGLSQASIAFVSLFGWYELLNSVYNGEIASDLLKPMNFFTYWLAKDLGRAAAALLTRGVTMMLLYGALFGINLPHSPAQWLGVLAAVVLAWLVSFSWRYLVNLAAFWTPGALGIARFAFTLSWFFSGFFMPLRFFPDWFRTLAYLTPFPHTINTIVEIYLGIVQGPEMLLAIGQQVVWAIALIVLGQVALHRGVRTLVVQGG